MMPCDHLFEIIFLILLHQLKKLSQMLVHGLRICFLHEALIENDLFGDLEIVLQVFFIVDLEAQPKQLVVESPQDTIYEHPVILYLLYYAVIGEEIVIKQIGESGWLGEYLAISVGEQARILLVAD